MNKVVAAISERRSIRNYDESADITDKLKLIENKIIELSSKPGPFGNYVGINLVSDGGDSSQIKLGTYGMIRGAHNYLVVTIKPGTNYLLDLGYVFEQLVIYATSIGLGTVWMAGTFSRKHFKASVNIKNEIEMPIVAPIGIEGGKKSLLAKIGEKKPRARKPFGNLFFAEDGKTSLVYEQSNPLLEALEMIRLAPSSMNKQPWRVVQVGNRFHFYKSSKKEVYDIDMGIALSHLVMTLESYGISGEFISKPNSILNNYCMTWVQKEV